MLTEKFNHYKAYPSRMPTQRLTDILAETYYDTEKANQIVQSIFVTQQIINKIREAINSYNDKLKNYMICLNQYDSHLDICVFRVGKESKLKTMYQFGGHFVIEGTKGEGKLAFTISADERDIHITKQVKDKLFKLLYPNIGFHESVGILDN